MGFVFACGYCQVPLKGAADKSPSCGQRETFDNVKRIVASFSGRARITIEEMLRTVGESLTYSDALLSKPVNRFIAVEIGDCLEAYALLARRVSARCRIWGGQKARRQLHLTRRPGKPMRRAYSIPRTGELRKEKIRKPHSRDRKEPNYDYA